MEEEIIDINENRHRYHLTREATQKDLLQRFGVQIRTIGKYYPNRALASARDPPLSIGVKGRGEGLSGALSYIRSVLENGPPASTNPALNPYPAPAFSLKVFVQVTPEPGRFSLLRSLLLGPPPGAPYLRHIQAVSGATVQLRGAGSGHVEVGVAAEQQRDSQEAMHLLLGASTAEELEKGRILADDLAMVVKWRYEQRYPPKPASNIAPYPGALPQYPMFPAIYNPQ